MYPEELVAPMITDLTSVGFEELKSPDAVDALLNDHKGTALVVINSVCGCAAGQLRPAVKASINADIIPDKLTTVFAGVDKEATEHARKYMLPYPPSSPSIALFKDGQLVHFIERHHIEGRQAEMIADHLKEAYKEFCS